MKKATTLLAIFITAACICPGKEKKPKPWTEWSQKDAQKILDDSAWGQTQVEADVSEMFFTPTTGSNPSRAARGALNQSVPLNLRIRLLSAKPIRQAFARAIELQQKTPNKQLSESLRGFVVRQFDRFIVVAVDYDCRDQRFSGQAMQLFNSATGEVLKNNTYLETKDGKKLFLMDYRPPISDGMGAKFVFPRAVDGQPFVKEDSGELRFYSEVSKTLTLNMRFRVSDFMYEGVLEY